MTTPESVKKERNDTADFLASSLWDGDFACSLSKTPEGRRRVVVASYDDEMVDVYARVHAGERPVTLCVRVGTWGVVYPTWHDVPVGTSAGDGDVHDLAPNAKLGMFLGYLMERDAPVSFRLTAPELATAPSPVANDAPPSFALAFG